MYSLKQCEDLIYKYANTYGGEVVTISEGVLGLGQIMLTGVKGKKHIIITEFYINPWSSGHKIRMYNKLPKKYARYI